ncbi:helix-turn-helix domain-containing protein [Vibrio sp. S4M6]|uniref:helix-turn-helix domain-containing protein n=1 Tax=Vibrio sinus TaxID=2946865 RepID=UPI00202A28A1|nr:helix-turn-helix transcriptional regulator [Vibrio sinus]MCL9781782.1 helix-turn-helix domain-containing protein [Vibrio sinus]
MNQLHFMKTSKQLIADRLCEARVNAGYKFTKDFASENSISYTTYSQHEKGKRSIKPEALVNYAEVLDVSVEWLITGQSHSSASFSNTENYAIDTNLLLDIYDQVQRMSEVMGIDKESLNQLKVSCQIYNSFNTCNGSSVGLFKIIVDHLTELKSEIKPS